MVIGLHKRLVGAALLLALPFTGCGKQDSAAGSGNSGGSGSSSSGSSTKVKA